RIGSPISSCHACSPDRGSLRTTSPPWATADCSTATWDGVSRPTTWTPSTSRTRTHDERTASHTVAPCRRHPLHRSRTAGAGLRRRTPHTRCGGTEGRVITQPSPATTRPAPDPYQQKVIDATERSIRVVAPAGSGKTETLARRVEERIRQGIPGHRILVLTFDRNAAESFRSKMRN